MSAPSAKEWRCDNWKPCDTADPVACRENRHERCMCSCHEGAPLASHRKVAHDEAACIAKANKALAEVNARLKTSLSVNIKTGGMRQSLTLPVEKVNKKGARPPVIVPTYCPLCGEKT